MRASRAKQAVGVVLAAAAVVAIAAALVIAGLSVRHTGTGADPARAFSEPQAVPDDLSDLISWQASSTELARQVEPATRLLVEDAWVSAWQEVDLVQRGNPSAVEARFMPGINERIGEAGTGENAAALVQHSHSLETTFYSLDGSVMTLDVASELERVFFDGPTLRSLDRFEVVMLLSDGKWRVLRLRRVDTSLSVPS